MLPIKGASSVPKGYLSITTTAKLELAFEDKRNRGQCPVPGCTIPTTYPKLHALQTHLPGIFSECGDQQELASRRVSALTLLATWVMGRPSSLQELVSHLIRTGVLDREGDRQINPTQQEAAEALCRELGVAPPETFTLCPLSSPGLLGHWRVLTLTVALLTDHRREFLSIYDITPQDTKESLGLSVPVDQKNVEDPLPEAFDSHFHMDRTR